MSSNLVAMVNVRFCLAKCNANVMETSDDFPMMYRYVHEFSPTCGGYARIL